MEKTSLENFIVAVLGALGGWKAIEYFLYRKEMKRLTRAKAIAEETDPLIKRYATLEQNVKELNSKIDELYKRMHKLEEDKLELMRGNILLQIQLEETRKKECLNENCPIRIKRDGNV